MPTLAEFKRKFMITQLKPDNSNAGATRAVFLLPRAKSIPSGESSAPSDIEQPILEDIGEEQDEDDWTLEDLEEELAQEENDGHFEQMAMTLEDVADIEDLMNELNEENEEESQERDRLIGEGLERAFFDLSILRRFKTEQASLIETQASLVKDMPTIDEIEEMERVYDQIEDMSVLLSTPLGIEEADLSAELEELDEDEDEDEDEVSRSDSSSDAQLEELAAIVRDMPMPSLSEDQLGFYENICDQLVLAQENMDSLEQQEAEVVACIQRLQALLNIREERSMLSFGRRKKAKAAGGLVLVAAKYLVPVIALPIELTKQVLSVVSFAKTMKHILRLKALKNATTSSELGEIIDYALAQKKKKAATKGVNAFGGSIVTTAYSAVRAGYKKAKGTKGKMREAEAKRLHHLLLDTSSGHDPLERTEAIKFISELVGPSNLQDVREEDGWQVIATKLRSR